MEPLFRNGTYYSRVIVKAMLENDMDKLREAMLSNEINVLIEAVDNGEDIDLLQIISGEVRRIVECDSFELMDIARSQCHWENLDL